MAGRVTDRKLVAASKALLALASSVDIETRLDRERERRDAAGELADWQFAAWPSENDLQILANVLAVMATPTIDYDKQEGST